MLQEAQARRCSGISPLISGVTEQVLRGINSGRRKRCSSACAVPTYVPGVYAWACTEAQRTYTLFGFLQNLLPLHPCVSVLQHLAKPCSSLTSHFNQLGRKAPTPECRTPHQTSRLEGLWSEQGTRQLHCFFFAQLGKVLLKDVTWLEMSCTKPNPGS